MEDLQDVVDDLAARIGRGVAIDDRQLRLLAHSAHDDDADDARRHSILTRRVPQALAEWAFSYGISTAQGPVRLPAAPAFGSHARVVFPLRAQGLLLGFLTIIDPERTLSNEHARACADATALAAAIRYRQRVLHDAEREREQQLVRALLFDDAEQRPVAVARLAAEGLMSGERVAAVVVTWDEDAPELDTAIHKGIVKACRTLQPGSAVEFARPRQAVLLLDAARLPETGARGFATTLLTLARETVAEASLAAELTVGFGDPVEAVAARVSHDQAMRALQVSERFAGLPNPVGCCDVGANRMLALFPLESGALAEIPPGCRELIRHPDLLHTVERYLDLACDVKATATELSLHRASLYSRLQKAERISGLSFKRGEDRLALHVGLRLLRLAGVASRSPKTRRSSDETPAAAADTCRR
jgi:hypothetical protein